MKKEWDLTLFYNSPDDSQIEKDLASVEKLTKDFVSKYSNSTDWLDNQEVLLTALKEYESLFEKLYAVPPLLYFHLMKMLNNSDSVVEARTNVLTEKYTKLGNEIMFFPLRLGKLEEKSKQSILSNPKFSHFKYFLERLFIQSKHHLSEEEEKIISLKASPSHALWVRGMTKLLEKQTIEYKGKIFPISEAMNLVSEQKQKDRSVLHNIIMQKLFEISDFAESEINAIYINKKIDDELRRFSKSYDATFLENENEEKEVLMMADAVRDANHISHRFYDLKAKILGIDELTYADRSAKIGEISRTFSFEESVKIIKETYSKLGGKYVKIFDEFLDKGHIDAFPKQNKSSGAFCIGEINSPTMVLLNHVNNASSLRTFAHEMGHAFHSEFSKSQTPLYQYYSTPVAETASTLFEDFTFYSMLELLSKQEKVIALHNRINEEISTIFRQIACFDFEIDLHSQIREKGSLSKEEIANLLNTHMQKYLGPRFKLTEKDGYFFVLWIHIRDFFYVYGYAYGRLVSRALYQKYRENNSFLEEIEKFLSAGGSKSPHDIFMDMGINTNDPEFWKAGLKGIENDLNSLEKLILK